MFHYNFRPKNPLVKPNNYDFGRNHQSLYDLDRDHYIKMERPDKRDLIYYDRGIAYEKKKEDQKKEWLMKEAQELLNKSPQKKKSFSLTFNEFNGYKVEYNGVVFETYNYLFNDYIRRVFDNDFKM